MANELRKGLSAQYATRAREVSIYALRDEHGVVRYVGKANDPAKRLLSHYRDSRRRNTPICCWIQKCLSRGVRPIMETLEVCSVDSWPDRERYWISRFKSDSLLNVAEGGYAPSCSLETRQSNGAMVAKLRVSTSDRKRLYEMKRQLCQGFRKGYVSEGTKAKLREGMKRNPGALAFLAKWL